MLRVIAFLATVATAGTMAGTTSAHPPDLYDTSYSTQPYYGTTTYSQPSSGITYTQPYTTTQSYVTQPYSGSSYGTSAYISPTYTSTSTYTPSYRTTPLKTQTYRSGSSYSGFSSPGYGYRHRRPRPYYGGHNSYGTTAHGHRGRGYGPYGYVRNAYYDRPIAPDRHRSFGPYSSIPTTEGFNVGYAGGPTFGTDSNPVINGVRLNGPPD